MVYGAEAVLPSDIHHDSSQVAAYIEADNEQACQDAHDLLDEKRDLAATMLGDLPTGHAPLSQLPG